MAEFTLNFRTIFGGSGFQTIDKTVQVTADGVDLRNVQITAGQDRLVTALITLARLKGYYIVSDQDLKMETNTSVGTGTAGETVNLVANQPISWYQGCGYTPHFTANVTALYFTNLGSTTANVQIRIAQDDTP